MFVKFSYFANFSLRTQHVSSKHQINARAHDPRPDTLVQVSARSIHSGARGRRSIFVFRREWIRLFPWLRYEMPHIYIPWYVCLSNVSTFANFSLRKTFWSAWQALNDFFPAGVDNKMISLVSIREAFFCTYVPLKCRHIFVVPTGTFLCV